MISIAARLKPFTHQPGARCFIPTTTYLVEAFPARIRVRKFSGEIVKEFELEIDGPLKNFTLMQDLERGCVTLFSECYHLHILPSLEVVFQKKPHLPPLKVQERLSLGSHKKQEWENIRRRCDFREIFPIWFRLGSLLSLPQRIDDSSGMFFFLKKIREALYEHRPEKIIPLFQKLFLAGFSQMLIPRAQDEDYQGIVPFNHSPGEEDSPLFLLAEGSSIIRSLFLINALNEISILPNLPPELFVGRMTHLSCLPYGWIDLEWSKKTIRRVHFHALQDAEILLHFPADMKKFRLRTNRSERGETLSCGDSLVIKSGSHYLLDQFQK